MNKKAEKFDLLIADLNKGGNSWFTKEEMTDDLHTVVYHGRLDVHEHSLPVFIVVDDSAFPLQIIRLLVFDKYTTIVFKFFTTH